MKHELDEDDLNEIIEDTAECIRKLKWELKLERSRSVIVLNKMVSNLRATQINNVLNVNEVINTLCRSAKGMVKNLKKG